MGKFRELRPSKSTPEGFYLQDPGRSRVGKARQGRHNVAQRASAGMPDIAFCPKSPTRDDIRHLLRAMLPLTGSAPLTPPLPTAFAVGHTTSALAGLARQE
jgi:hypothetical protein